MAKECGGSVIAAAVTPIHVPKLRTDYICTRVLLHNVRRQIG